MSERDGGPVAPGVVEGAQEFFRKRKRAYFRAEKRGELNGPVLHFLVSRAMRQLAEKMNRDLHRMFYS